MHVLAAVPYAGDAAAVTYLGWRYVMARGTAYTPEEDAIILSTTNTRDILAALAAAGYPERTPNAVKQRKNELRNGGKGKRLGGVTRTRTPSADSVTAAATRYDTAQAHLKRLEDQLEAARQEVQDARKALAVRLAREE